MRKHNSKVRIVASKTWFLDRQASNHPVLSLQAPHEWAQASVQHLSPGERQG